MNTRRGTILILVAGICAILAAMTLTFLLQMRGDIEESQAFTREIQARVMLTSGLLYIQETARLGWSDPLAIPANKTEAFGWTDIRDGAPGPKDQLGRTLPGIDPITGKGDFFPAVGGAAARCPMYVMRRPPCAVAINATPNPMVLDPALAWKDILNNKNFDPMPAVTNDYAAFLAGDTSARFPSTGWFRVYRKEVPEKFSVFIITCGAGGTLGFRDWTEVVASGEQDSFASKEAFEEMRLQEPLMWFEAEWNPAVGHNIVYHYSAPPLYSVNRLGDPRIPGPGTTSGEAKPVCRQFGGTFLYIERLPRFGETVPPPEW